MITFKLHRVVDNTFGTFGVLMDERDVPFCLTLELSWNDNKRNKSCIPRGYYVCQRIDSPKFGDTFQVMHVKDRDNILFHKGNVNANTKGCILLGEQFEEVLGQPGIAHSGKGFNEFMSKLKGIEKFQLIIY